MSVHLDKILQALGGRRTSENEILTHCPAHKDRNPSLSITAQADKLLVKCFAGCDQASVIAALKTRGLWPKSVPKQIAPGGIPATWRGKRLTAKWLYRDLDNKPLGIVARYDDPNGKDMIPFFKRDGQRWVSGAAPVPRPLYGLDELPGFTGDIVIVEGEKAADAAQRLLTDAVALTWPGGSNAVRKADWTHMRGRNVVVWPDNDEPGLKAACDVEAMCREAGATSVRILTPPVGKPKGWDAADAVNEGWTKETFAAWLITPEASEQAEQQAVPPQFTVLRRDDLMNLSDIDWIIKGVMPSRGIGAVHGPSTAGKSFLMLDMAAHIAEGREWFGYRTQRRPIAYACLEGQYGFRRRIQAWEQYHGRRYPKEAVFLPDPLDLRNLKDTGTLCDVIRRELGEGCVVIVDTLNRAAPGMEENSSVDYGLILANAGRIEQAVQGFVCFVGHPGKDTSKGFRGHSSMFAALDMNIELLPVPSADGLSSWVLRKAKDGRDGITKHFRREVVELGQDSDGDMVTSCVIIPDPESDAIQASTSKAMTQKDGERFESYRQAAMDYGILDDAGSFIGLDPEDWRTHFYARSAAPTAGARRAAFYKAKNGLIRAGWLNETLEGLLLPKGPGAEVHVETIGTAIRERTGRTEACQARTGTPAVNFSEAYRTVPPPYKGGTGGTLGTGSGDDITDEEI